MPVSSAGSDSLFRARDVLGASAGLVLLSPVIGATYVLVRAKLGSPAIFRQQRPGLNGQVFTIYKFRTMLAVDPDKGWVSDEARLTHFGRVLRSTSLDELPSLVNVLKGDMSLVGPRPLLAEYLDRYTPTQSRRHEVRPGLTGLAQVSGRNAVSWEERLELDVWYVDNRSFWLDIKILWRTVVQVLRRAGVAAEGHPTMPQFEGEAERSTDTAATAARESKSA